MSKVNVRELREQSSEIVRRVREDRETFDLTYQGEIIGHIVPKRPASDPIPPEKRWEEWEALIKEMNQYRTDDVPAEETMREIRRQL
jgi:antitoxin (DNA-binding transcriptional repressor) of toxin-antitoxin stability system